MQKEAQLWQRRTSASERQWLKKQVGGREKRKFGGLNGKCVALQCDYITFSHLGFNMGEKESAPQQKPVAIDSASHSSEHQRTRGCLEVQL